MVRANYSNNISRVRLLLVTKKGAGVQDICEQMGRTPAWISASCYVPTDMNGVLQKRRNKGDINHPVFYSIDSIPAVEETHLTGIGQIPEGS